MIWRFEDGTTVELGGNVDGAKLFAQWLRLELAERKMVFPHPPSAPGIPFDPNDPALLDNLLGYLARARNVKLTERPDGIPALPPPPWDDSQTSADVVH
jgi:hypothetical protein